MDCFFCKGQTEERLTKFMIDLGECVLIVKNVPTRVCKQCGEKTYSDETAQKLEEIVNAVKQSIMTEIAIVDYRKDVA